MENETSVNEEVKETVDTQVATSDETTEGKVYTQQELDDIIKKNVDRAIAKAKKEATAEIAEAEKVRKMNTEQKLQHELQKRDEKIAQYEREKAMFDMEKQATALLRERSLNATDDLLRLVVKDTAEDTLQAINTIESILNNLVDDKVKQMLKGQTPVSVNSPNAKLTKAEFDKLPYLEKAEIYNTNKALYDELKE